MDAHRCPSSLLIMVLLVSSGIELHEAKLNDSRLQVNSSASAILKCDNYTKVECNADQSGAGFIAKTSDAIYRALAGVFSFHQAPADQNSTQTEATDRKPSRIEPDSGANATKLPAPVAKRPPPSTQSANKTANATEIATTTPKPTTSPTKAPATTQLPKVVHQNTSTSPPVSSNQPESSTAATSRSDRLVQNQTASSFLSELKPEEVYTLIHGALRSIYWLRDSIFLNRSTRVAPHEEEEAPRVRPHKDKLKEASMISTDDVHLLCKLLHRHLHQNGTQLNSSSADEPNLRPVAPTVAPPEGGAFVDELRRLDERHERHLLESAFSYEPARRRPANESAERAAERLLAGLFSEAAARWRQPRPADYEAPDSLDEDRLSVGGPAEGEPLRLRVWRRLNVSPGHLHLVYWLAERAASGRRGFRLLNAQEANRLLEEHLDEPAIERRLAAANLTVAGPLVAPYRSAEPGDQHLHRKEPQVADESLQAGGQRSGLQLLVERLSHASFGENLHLYLIIFLLVLLAVILCFAVPMICCRWRADSEAGRLRRRRRRKERPPSEQAEPAGPRALEQPAPSKAADAVWRKLSNTTTTLTREHEASLRDRLEFYSVEDRRLVERRLLAPEELAPSRLLAQADGGRRQLSKSVQTFGEQRAPEAAERSSDTLSKSELLMVKEKMIPIGLATPDYVNRAAFGPAPGARYIDSSPAASAADELELAAGARARAQPLRAELGRLEQRDPRPGSYLRYPDVA